MKTLNSIALLGPAGSGKDTAADILSTLGPVRKVALAEPIKQFAGDLFLFDEHQLYGPSHNRNAVDKRYSYDQNDGWVIDFDMRYRGLKGLWNRFLDWRDPQRIAPPDFDYTLEEIYTNRQSVWSRLNLHEQAFLDKVVPSSADMEWARHLLRKTLQQILQVTRRNITPRLVLQMLGTEFGRNVCQDIWLIACIKRLEELNNQGFIGVVTDCRFVSEAKGFYEAGIPVLRISRGNNANNEAQKAGVANHASELDMSSGEIDRYVYSEVVNDGSLEDLRTNLLLALSDA